MKKLLLIAALVVAGSALSACGQKGGLYLPDNPENSYTPR